MKILWIGGNHPRHLHYVNTIHRVVPIAGGIMECREALLPKPPEGLDTVDRDNFVRHFENRDKAEQKYFGEQEPPDCPILKVDRETLNSKVSADFVREGGFDAALIFGCGLIKDPLYSALPANTINMHLGLSPRYRGSATLFWPFYFMEPCYAGSTFHYIIGEPDAGDVIHQVVPDLDPGDGIHDVACKCVVKSSLESVKLLEVLAKNKRWARHKQKATGKNFLSSDFKPQHLRVIYNDFDDDMVKQFLEGRLASKTPKLVRQF